MAQQFDYPKTETQLREIQDKLYQHSKEVYDAGGRPAFKGLLEIMSAEATIITAIHNIKSNRGSETPGVDSKTMRKDYEVHPPSSALPMVSAFWADGQAKWVGDFRHLRMVELSAGQEAVAPASTASMTGLA